MVNQCTGPDVHNTLVTSDNVQVAVKDSKHAKYQSECCQMICACLKPNPQKRPILEYN
ncbi:hypothetical protein cypCar_00003493, partial [Cyprinus carpio]